METDRFKINLGFIKGAIMAVVLFSCSVQYAQERPNIIFILADDLGSKDIGCYGGPVKTPNLDELAANGVRFETFYAGSNVCSPSRATSLTGRHHIRTGVYNWLHKDYHKAHLLEREITLAELLKENGYETAHFGKWHLGMTTEQGQKPNPDDHGFDYWFVTDNNAIPSHRNPANFVRNGESVGELEGYSCDLVVNEAFQWVEERESFDKPFFMNVWFHEPHFPLAAPDKLVDNYGEGEEALYSATIDNTDRAIGRLLERLRQISAMQNTLIIYASDNGSYLKSRNGDLRGVKGQNWEGGLRVPGIFYWSDVIPEGKVVNGPAGVVDLVPTICGLIDIDKPEVHLDGEDVSNVILGEEEMFTRKKPMFWHLQKSRPIVAIRDGNYVLLAEPDYELSTRNLLDEAWIPSLREGGYKEYKLYDLKNDPSQKVDIATDNPELTQRMKSQLLEINASVMSDGPVWGDK